MIAHIRTAMAAAMLGLMGVVPAVWADEAGQVGAEVPQLPARHGVWTALLETYVRAHADGVNRFDYGTLKDNASDRAVLAEYIASFETLDFDALSREEAFAAWANLYNAVTVQHIIDRYPVRSIRSGYLFGGPWKEVTTLADGRELSLDEIEHQILRAEWSDPRVHYAVNCASIGCPNLQAKAWEAATLDVDLDAAARAYINHPRGVTVRSRGGLTVSSIYNWFEEDFGGTEAGVIEHLLTYAEPELAAQIRATPDIRGYDYDWDLNDVD